MASISPVNGSLLPDPNQPPVEQQATPASNPLIEDQTQPIGEKYENLAKSIQLVIWDLLMQQERQDEIARRNEIKEILRRKLYYKDEQYWWWSADQGQMFPPSVAPDNSQDYEQPAFQHVTNIIRAFSESLQSVISQNNTAARFWPKKASDPKNVQTAKEASKVVDLIHQKNDWQNLIDDATFYMCTDGFFAGYVRFVTDAEKYGSEDMDVYSSQDVQVAPPTVECPCGFQQEGTTDTQPICPDCGNPTEDIPAVMATVPQHMGSISIPNGQEVITIIPALNFRRTMWADDQEDFLYAEWVYDVHKARAMAMYPNASEQINNSGGGYGDGGTSTSYERIARRLLYVGYGRFTGSVLQDLGEFRHAWIRPCTFETVRDKDMKAMLQHLYAKGCFVTFYNDIYCESRSECMDEYLESMQTCDGEGQVRPTLISSIMPIQDQLNDSINLLFEQAMNGVAEAFGDQNTIDFEARGQTISAPGNMTPVDLQPGQDIRSKVFFSEAIEPASALVEYIQQLFSEIPQFLTGAFPALFGGNTGANDTASGIAIQRNQALGRIGRSWRRLQIFCANLDGKAVNCFKSHMTQDVEIPKEDGSGGYESDWVRIENMQGEVIAYPEVDAQYPVLQADIRGLLMSLMNEGNPLFLSDMQQPENREYLYREIGIGDVEVPGEQQRIKTRRDIDQLLQEQPVQGQPIPAQPSSPQNPQGSPEMPGPMIPSVEPDPIIDDLSVALNTTQEFMISDEGQEAKTTQPAGFQNVYLYAKACQQLIKNQQFQNAIASQGIQGTGPGADLAGAEQIQSPASNNPHAPEPPQQPSPSAS